jgi:hypothetical protein
MSYFNSTPGISTFQGYTYQQVQSAQADPESVEDTPQERSDGNG